MDGEEGQKPNYKETVGGQRSSFNKGGSFENSADIAGNALKNPNLYPDKNLSTWQKAKRWIAGGAAASAIIGTGVVTAQKVEQNAQDPLYGQAVNGEVQVADLISSSTFKTNVSDINPTEPIFRKSPDQYSDEYSKEDLENMGINVDSGKIEVEKVWGKPYASDLQSASVYDEKTGRTHGVWGEIVSPDPEKPGQYKGTGVYLSENFFSIEKPDTTSSSESQNINQASTTTNSSSEAK